MIQVWVFIDFTRKSWFKCVDRCVKPIILIHNTYSCLNDYNYFKNCHNHDVSTHCPCLYWPSKQVNTHQPT